MVVLSEGRHSYIHMFESNASMLSRVIFYLKNVHFLFLFSIDSRIPKLAKFEISRYAVRFLTDLFGNPNDAFFFATWLI